MKFSIVPTRAPDEPLLLNLTQGASTTPTNLLMDGVTVAYQVSADTTPIY